MFQFSYRTREQIKEVRTKRDPITHFKERIIECGLVTAEEIKVFLLFALLQCVCVHSKSLYVLIVRYVNLSISGVE